MKRVRQLVFSICALFGVALGVVTTLHAEPKLLPPLDLWSGKVAEVKLREKAPESQVVTSAESFEKLWKAWRSDDELPKVDFSKDLVLVATLPGPNRVLIKPWLLDDGNLHIQIMGSKLEGDGFGYSLWRLHREGIKTVEGEPLGK